MRIDRRRFLGGATAAGAALVTGPVRVLPAPAQPADGPFQHGVASGDPLADAVVIWTRVTTDADAVAVRWTVATDEALRTVVRSGDAEARADGDHTVHVDVTGLDPATTYFYGFDAVGARSPVGRTRTAPDAATPTERLRIGLVSCGRWATGYFNAYGRLAARDVDLVVHVGDYIYEDGGSATRLHDPPTPLRSLGDYRTRYAQYRTDPDLQELHRRHPMANVWDDHELAGNAWRDGARDHDDSRDGPWPQRRDAAAQAWREWLPFRAPDPADPLRIWRALPFGSLADVVLLDTRLWGRDQQVEPRATIEALADPNRRLLGDSQRTWLEQQLAGSQAVWKIVGNQVMLSPLSFPAPVAAIEDAFRERGFVVGAGEGRNPDQWDGYEAERQRVLQAIEANAVRNVVVLTGDIHSSFVSDVADDVTELVGPSVTSANFDELLGSAGATTLLESALRSANPGVRYAELQSHGYVVLDVTAERLQADWWFVDHLDRRDPAEHAGTSWVVEALAAVPAAEADAPAPEPEPVARDDGDDTSGDDRLTLAVGGAGAVAAVAGGAVLALRRRRRNDDG